jgi:hypothetical protein
MLLLGAGSAAAAAAAAATAAPASCKSCCFKVITAGWSMSNHVTGTGRCILHGLLSCSMEPIAPVGGNPLRLNTTSYTSSKHDLHVLWSCTRVRYSALDGFRGQWLLLLTIPHPMLTTCTWLTPVIRCSDSWRRSSTSLFLAGIRRLLSEPCNATSCCLCEEKQQQETSRTRYGPGCTCTLQNLRTLETCMHSPMLNSFPSQAASACNLPYSLC